MPIVKRIIRVVKRLLLSLAALWLTACAEATPAPTHPAFVFITATPSPAASGAPTEEVLPFRDLSTATPTDTLEPPSPTSLPPSTTPVPPVATAQPTVPPAVSPSPSRPALQLQVQGPTAPALINQPPVPAPTDPPPSASPAPAQPVADVGGAEQSIIDLTNLYRAQNGLAALARDEAMMNVARSRSNDMVARGFFGHYDPVTGQSLAKPLVLALGYGRAGENIYWSGRPLADTPAVAVNWFMGDAPHRANLLNSGYTVIGVGIAWNGQGWMLTQNFGGP